MRILGNKRSLISKTLIASCFALAFVGCATVTPYGAAVDNQGFGFAEQQIESDRYRVTFNGNASTSRQMVENYLLYRAAELTIENGGNYFVMLTNDTEAHKTYSVQSRFPRYGRRSFFIGPREDYYHYPYYSYGFDWGPDYDTKVHEFTAYSAEAYILIKQGAKPGGEANAFDADEVLENLSPFVRDAAQNQN